MRILWIAFLLLIGCADPVTTEPAPNILVILGDDMGVETLSSYGIGTPTAVTPNLDQLAAGECASNDSGPRAPVRRRAQQS